MATEAPDVGAAALVVAAWVAVALFLAVRFFRWE
jgi:hypothetical protein